MPELKIASALLIYGPLGIMCLLFIIIAIRKDMQLTKERERHDKTILELTDKHKVEMHALEERYVTKAETWVAKHQELATSQDETIKSLKGMIDYFRGIMPDLLRKS